MNFFRKFKYILITIAIVLGLAGSQLVAKSFSPENIYRKDFIQEYFLARAVLAGYDPYLPLPELAEKLGITLPYAILPHSTPHPPPIALLSFPLATLSYEQAALAWLLIEMACLLASIVLMWRWWRGDISIILILLIAWAALGWAHIWADFVLGQINTILLLLLTISWLRLRKDEPPGTNISSQIGGGLALGCVVALKFIGWPIVIFLLMRRKWISAVAAAASALTLNLIAALIMGWQSFFSYFSNVAPLIYYYYRAHCGNLSLWSVGWRLFSGTASPSLISIESPPLIYAPTLAKLISFALPFALLVFGLRWSFKMKNFDLAYGIMVAVSVLISPVMWAHYVILAAIPMLITVHALSQMNFPRKQTAIAAATILIVSIPYSVLANTMTIFRIEQVPDGPEVVPFAAGLLSLVPPLCLLILLRLMRRLSRMLGEEIPQAL